MFIALVFIAHIYVDLIVSATNVFVAFLSTINKHFLLSYSRDFLECCQLIDGICHQLGLIT